VTSGRLLILIILIEMFVAAHPCYTGQASNNDSGKIVVTVTNIRSAEGGNLIVSLYSLKESWLRPGEARITEVVPIEGDSSVVEFASLPYDSIYAVAVIHDRNMNGSLDMRKFPWPRPKEGTGVSNNNFGFGPPGYEDALLHLSGPVLDIRIEMRY
jgi:uncharacterized protein (DUF2141 family)